MRAAKWEHAERAEDFLFGGSRLQQAEEISESHAADLTDLEQAFIQAGVDPPR